MSRIFSSKGFILHTREESRNVKHLQLLNFICNAFFTYSLSHIHQLQTELYVVRATNNVLIKKKLIKRKELYDLEIE